MKKADQKENSRNLRISQFLIKMSVIILAAGIVVFLWGSNVLFQKASYVTVHSILSNVAQIYSRLPVAMEFWFVCLGIVVCEQ